MLKEQGFAPAQHHRALIKALQDVADGRCDRLMVLMPPGSAKSTYASKIFPAWWMCRQGRTNVIAASHTADLAGDFGRAVRGIIAEHGGETLLARDNRSAHRFATQAGGEYFSTGVQGPLTGRRADLALIDDPVKSHTVAESASQREGLWNWYRSELLTRLKPNGRVVLVMTRWHEDDLGGRLLTSPDGWRILRLPAIAEADDPIGRTPGEALWPEYQSLASLRRTQISVGSRVWSSLYQQSPSPPGGTLFPADRLQVVEQVPAGRACVRAWDLAATAATDGRDPDWTVGVKLGRDGERVFVLDVVRLRGGPNEVAQTIAAVASRDGQAVPVGLPQDPGQAGKMQVAWLSQMLAGHRIQTSPETGSKLMRATPAAAAAEAGNLLLARGAWNEALVGELREFPHGAKDDQVDALSRAFGMLAVAAVAPARRVQTGFFTR